MKENKKSLIIRIGLAVPVAAVVFAVGIGCFRLQQKKSEIISDAEKNGSSSVAELTQSTNGDDAALAGINVSEVALAAPSEPLSDKNAINNTSAADKTYIGWEEALNLACAHTGLAAEDIIKMEIELDADRGVMIYEAEFETDIKKCEYRIDAVTGELLNYESKEHKSSYGDAYGYIGAVEAEKAALSHSGVAAEEVLQVEAELYSEDNTMIYNAEFETETNKYEYKINAETGGILSNKEKAWKNTSESKKKTEAKEGVGSFSAASESSIGEEAALSSALKDANVEISDPDDRHIELHRENDKMVYGIAFRVGHRHYYYKIDAESGEILMHSYH